MKDLNFYPISDSPFKGHDVFIYRVGSIDVIRSSKYPYLGFTGSYKPFLLDKYLYHVELYTSPRVFYAVIEFNSIYEDKYNLSKKHYISIHGLHSYFRSHSFFCFIKRLRWYIGEYIERYTSTLPVFSVHHSSKSLLSEDIDLPF